MSGFAPAWLALREPYDHAARDRALTADFAAALGPASRLVDLGAGSGANLRFLAPHLPAGQRWTCIDHDSVLLERLEATAPDGIDVATRRLDLAADLEQVPIEAGAGVIGSALLDLVSAAWLDRLAARCRDNPVLMTLSFDGRMAWTPPDPADPDLRETFLRHQRSDKGFGPSLGADAAGHLAGCLRDLGHAVRLARSDWRLEGDGDQAILEAMLAGMIGAVHEIDPAMPIEPWVRRRRAELEAGRLGLRVGHLDLLALPRPAD